MKTAPDKWGSVITRDFSGVKRLRELRGVKSFADFPKLTQVIYLAVARCFPGVQVWAVGSRVRGDYKDKNDGLLIRNARIIVGMKDKAESDFDFLVAPDAVQVGELPPNAERVRCVILEKERIEIPIYYGMGLDKTT